MTARSIHKLTDSRVAAARPKEKVYAVSDGGGLSLRVQTTGSRTWVYVFWFDGKQRRMGLGSYPAVSLAEARRRRDEARRIRETEDPIAARKKQKELARRDARGDGPPRTVQDLFDKWLETDLVRRADRGDRAKRYFDRDVAPVIGDKRLSEISQADIWQIRDRMRTAKRPRRSKNADGSRLINMTLADVRQMFSFGVSRGYTNVEPTVGIKKSAFGGTETPRDRWLPETELRQLATILPTSGLSAASQEAVWLLLATGNRVGETYKSRWEEINFQTRTWFIPAANRKGTHLHPAKDHYVWLNDFALARLCALKALTESSPFLFPHKHDQNAGAPENSLRRQIAYLKHRLYTGGRAWTPHDLRRTTATILQSVKTPNEVIDRCIGHYACGDPVSGAYFHWDYEEESVAAWRLLGEKLTAIYEAAQAQKQPSPPGGLAGAEKIQSAPSPQAS